MAIALRYSRCACRNLAQLKQNIAQRDNHIRILGHQFKRTPQRIAPARQIAGGEILVGLAQVPDGFFLNR
jgi:hypothetical protein